jgi:hypothetical protein
MIDQIGWTGVGFTGSRHSTQAQRERIDAVLDQVHSAVWIITGGCIGVDAYVAESAHRRGLHVHTVLPADRSRVDPHWRERCTTYDEMPAGTTYKDRNQRIIDLTTEHLFAYPEAAEDDARSLRSGTWQTVRLGRHAGKRIHVNAADDRPRASRPPDSYEEA